MIPKIIHYCWFSGEPYPAEIQECMASWKKAMPDYEFRLWDAKSIADIDSVWLRECMAEKKWAFAADYVRLYALVNYGGIYLDTDCMVYQSFDALLTEKCFIGRENHLRLDNVRIEVYLASHCLGAEKGNPFVAHCLYYYQDRHFVLSRQENIPRALRYDMTLMPYIQSEIAKLYGYNPIPSYNKIQHLEHLTIYPKQYFDPRLKSHKTLYCRHMAAGAWLEHDTFIEQDSIRKRMRWLLMGIMRRLLAWI